jgi:hypothetical protein
MMVPLVVPWWCRGGAVYDLFPFVVSVGDLFPFVPSGLRAWTLNHWPFFVEQSPS